MNTDEFNKKLDQFGKACADIGMSDPALCFDPSRGMYKERMQRLRKELREAYATVHDGQEQR